MMSTQATKNVDEAEIRQLADNWARAIRAKNIDALMSHYTPDILVFDLAPPLQYAGIAAYRKNFDEWFSSFQGRIGLEIHNLSVSGSDDVAFSHSLNRISGKRTSGEETDVWVRATVCYRKKDGKWRVAHEHVSVPFYMDGSYKAAVDLQP
jgi:uncharacterized protein (TIGR02246 family)